MPDLLESIMRPTDPVKDELRQKLFKMTQIRSEIKKIRVWTFQMAGKIRDSTNVAPPDHIGDTESSEAGTASSSTDPAPVTERRTHIGNETLSDSQAIEAYVSDTLDLGQETSSHTVEPQDAEAPQALLFSGLYHGHVTVGRYHYRQQYAIGTTEHGQRYVDLGSDPAEDSSWFDEMLKPLDTNEVPPHYPMQGSNWGLQR